MSGISRPGNRSYVAGGWSQQATRPTCGAVMKLLIPLISLMCAVSVAKNAVACDAAAAAATPTEPQGPIGLRPCERRGFLAAATEPVLLVRQFDYTTVARSRTL